MEEMISRWIRETLTEHERAKSNQNFYRMKEMKYLVEALRRLREDLIKSTT
jgi:hypothetical protein